MTVTGLQKPPGRIKSSSRGVDRIEAESNHANWNLTAQSQQVSELTPIRLSPYTKAYPSESPGKHRVVVRVASEIANDSHSPSRLPLRIVGRHRMPSPVPSTSHKQLAGRTITASTGRYSSGSH